jgi:HNH endonuclease
MVAIVDDDDFDRLSQWKWFALSSGGGRFFYAARRDYSTNETVLMHRQIAQPPQGALVDHFDRNTLNNSRKNLRVCTRGQNRSNSLPSSSTGLKGVTFGERGHGYYCQITHQSRRIHLGWFKDKFEAASAYDKAAIEFHGPFALTNKSLSLI